MSFRRFMFLLLGLIPLYLLLGNFIPPADDEFYYWCWAQNLQLSYYDHPPMTAYMIWLTTSIFGDSLLALRLPAIVSTLTVLVAIGWLTRPRQLLPFVVFTPLFTLGAVLVTPDTPLLMFWALYLLWLVWIHEKLDEANHGINDHFPGMKNVAVPYWGWPLGGLILGCGLLGKYTTGLAMISGFITFFFAGNYRRWLLGYTTHLVVAFLVTMPILIHNLRYDFVPILYQWRHSMSSSKPGFEPFFSFFGIQILLFGFLPFIVYVWSIANRNLLLENPRLRVCAILFCIPFTFFLFKATRGHLEGNWALACFISLWPVAAAWYQDVGSSRTWRRITSISFAIPACCVVAVTIHLIHPFSILEPRFDRITRQYSKIEIARELREYLKEDQHETIFTINYQWTAILRYYGIDARQIEGITRPSHFTQHPEQIIGRERALVFGEGFLPEKYVEGFDPPTILGRFPLIVRGQEFDPLWLIEYRRTKSTPRQAADTISP